jgi:hypothetical protein
MTMSTKINIAAFAALLSLAMPAMASAQEGFVNYLSAQDSRKASIRQRQLQTSRFESDAYGSVDGRAGWSSQRNDAFFGGRTRGRDPDANVRFEMQRDPSDDR